MRRVPFAVDVAIVLSAIWFFAAGWLVLGLLVSWVEPFVSLYAALAGLWHGLEDLVARLGVSMGLAGTLLGIALQGLFAAAVGLLLVGVWALLPVWAFVGIGLLGELRERRAVARFDRAHAASHKT
jgi:hypothetical protein